MGLTRSELEESDTVKKAKLDKLRAKLEADYADLKRRTDAYYQAWYDEALTCDNARDKR
jgi:hypothetical protein